MTARIASGDTHGERIARKTKTMNINTMNPWTYAIYMIISDGRWYDRDELIYAAALSVPPGRALRYTERRNARIRINSTLSKAAKRATGQRQEASQALLSTVRWNGTERDGERFRMLPEARNAWAAAHAARDTAAPVASRPANKTGSR